MNSFGQLVENECKSHVVLFLNSFQFLRTYSFWYMSTILGFHLVSLRIHIIIIHPLASYFKLIAVYGQIHYANSQSIWFQRGLCPLANRISDFGISSCIFCICLIEYRLEDVEKTKINAWQIFQLVMQIKMQNNYCNSWELRVFIKIEKLVMPNCHYLHFCEVINGRLL